MTPCATACQASLSWTISQSLLKLMSLESVVSSNHLILCYPLLLLPSMFPSISGFRVLWACRIRWPASASVLPRSIQGWFPLTLTGLISLISKELQVSAPAPQYESFGRKLRAKKHMYTESCMFQEGSVISGTKFSWKFKMRINVVTWNPSVTVRKGVSVMWKQKPDGKGSSNKYNVWD